LKIFLPHRPACSYTTALRLIIQRTQGIDLFIFLEISLKKNLFACGMLIAIKNLFVFMLV